MHPFCCQKPPVLKDCNFLVLRLTFQYNWTCQQRRSVLRDYIFVAESSSLSGQVLLYHVKRKFCCTIWLYSNFIFFFFHFTCVLSNNKSHVSHEAIASTDQERDISIVQQTGQPQQRPYNRNRMAFTQFIRKVSNTTIYLLVCYIIPLVSLIS